MTAWHDGTKYADYYGCKCPFSDAWRCAIEQRLPTIACYCLCHKYAEDEWKRKASLDVLDAASALSKEQP